MRSPQPINPLVSVLIPIYNAEQFVGKALESIINQTYGNIEIIAVDDASTDKSFSIIKEYQRKHPRIRVFRKKKNLGCAATLNYALSKAKGQFVACLEADDTAQAERIAKQVKYLLAYSEVVLVGGQFSLVDMDNRVWGHVHNPTYHDCIYKMLYFINPIHHSTIMINKKSVPKKELMYSTKWKTATDYDLLFRIAQYGKLANLGDEIVSVHQRRNSLFMGNFKTAFKEALTIRKTAVEYYGYKPSNGSIFFHRLQQLIYFLAPSFVMYYVFYFFRLDKVNKCMKSFMRRLLT